MSVLPIVKEPTPSLRERSTEVDKVFLTLPETKKFIQNMIDTMYAREGIGIAATQVGTNVRVCIIGKDAVTGKAKDLVLVNPEIQKTSRKTLVDTEGCLSVPGIYGKVKRMKDLDVKALDENGNPLSFKASNFFARVVQHEVDHLNGTLFIDKAKDVYEVDKSDRDEFVKDLRKKRGI